MESDTGLGMRMTIKGIRAKFSSVKNLSTETLAKWFADGNESKNIILMDCRAPSEFDISHLEGATRVDWEKVDPKDLLSSLPHDKPSTVVCYCSVGYRSSSVAQQIQQFVASSQDLHIDVQVYNLEGSLFKWANEGRPMVNSAGKSTSLCHPYNAVFGKLLSSQLRSKSSSSSME